MNDRENMRRHGDYQREQRHYFQHDIDVIVTSPEASFETSFLGIRGVTLPSVPKIGPGAHLPHLGPGAHLGG